MSTPSPIGEQLRDWRQRRRLSQLDLALDAEISTRHLSFVETGRAQPSRDMILRLAAELEIPLRDRNAMLLSAGFAPVFADRPLDDRSLSMARAAIEAVLSAHEPFPALAVDRHWNLVTANPAGTALMQGVAPHLLEPPINVLRLTLHPEGAAPWSVQSADFFAHVANCSPELLHGRWSLLFERVLLDRTLWREPTMTVGEIEASGDVTLASRVDALTKSKREVEDRLARIFDNFNALDTLRKDIGGIFSTIRNSLNRIG